MVSTYPDAGGAFKVQIYSPYVIVNKTGLPFNIASKTWSGTQKAAAGYDMFLGESAFHGLSHRCLTIVCHR